MPNRPWLRSIAFASGVAFASASAVHAASAVVAAAAIGAVAAAALGDSATSATAMADELGVGRILGLHIEQRLRVLGLQLHLWLQLRAQWSH